MSIVLAILCLNVGVALGMVLSGVLRAQRGAMADPLAAAAPSSQGAGLFSERAGASRAAS